MKPTEVTLSPRQEAVLEGIQMGRTYAEIGAQLGISERTIKAHSEHLRKKFATRGVPVKSSRALIPIAAEWFAGRG